MANSLALLAVKTTNTSPQEIVKLDALMDWILEQIDQRFAAVSALVCSVLLQLLLSNLLLLTAACYTAILDQHRNRSQINYRIDIHL